MFCNRLEQARLKKGMSQIDAAKALGVSQAAYSYFESGLKTPSFAVIVEIAKLFDVSIDLLAGRKEEEKTEG